MRRIFEEKRIGIYAALSIVLVFVAFLARPRSLGGIARTLVAIPSLLRVNGILASLATLLLLALVFVGVFRAEGESSTRRKWWNAPWVFALLAVVTVFLWRWPLFAGYEYNLDESQDIAGAITLLHDARFWVSVDVGTHGPLLIYPLLLPSLFGLTPEYGSARLVGLGAMLGSLACLYGLYQLYFSRAVARLLIVPAILCIAWIRYIDFLAYNGEHVTTFFCVLAAYLSARALRRESGGRFPRGDALAGFIAGCVPYAKVQGIPIVAAIGLLYVIARLTETGKPVSARVRAVLAYFVAALLPTVIVVAYLLSQGILGDVLRRYVVWNFQYATQSQVAVGPSSRILSFAQFWPWLAAQLSYETFCIWFALSAFAGLCAAVFFIATKRATIPAGLIFAGLLVFAAGGYAAYAPHRPFGHYLVLWIFPAAGLCGVVWGCVLEALAAGKIRQAVALVFVTVTLLFPLGDQWAGATAPHMMDGTIVDFVGDMRSRRAMLGAWDGPRRIVGLVRVYSTPQDSLTVWGWGPSYYVLTGMRQATPQAALYGEINGEDRLHDFLLTSFVASFHRAHPPIFIDEVGPNSIFYHDRRLYGHDAFPAMRAEVESNYDLVADTEQVRVYVRKDRRQSVEAGTGGRRP